MLIEESRKSDWIDWATSGKNYCHYTYEAATAIWEFMEEVAENSEEHIFVDYIEWRGTFDEYATLDQFRRDALEPAHVNKGDDWLVENSRIMILTNGHILAWN